MKSETPYNRAYTVFFPMTSLIIVGNQSIKQNFKLMNSIFFNASMINNNNNNNNNINNNVVYYKIMQNISWILGNKKIKKIWKGFWDWENTREIWDKIKRSLK